MTCLPFIICLQINGYTNDSSRGKVRLYEGLFENIRAGDKLAGKPADVFVSETFDAALIGENFLSILTHAKTNKFIKRNATIIPNSATIFIQLLESTFSLPAGRGAMRSGREDNSSDSSSEVSGSIASPFLAAGKYNLEPMRRHRPAGVYTVRYLNEQNAVRYQHTACQ